MDLPIITIQYLAILALIYTALSLTVVVLRFRLKVPFGDGGHEILRRAIRAHGNLGEYLPLAVLVVGSLEVLGVRPGFIHLAMGLIVLARLAHASAMFSLDLRSRRYFVSRVFGAGMTWAVITISSLSLAVIAFGMGVR